MNKRLLFLILILIITIFIFIIRQSTEFVYVSPRVNISTFPYIANTIKSLDNILDLTLLACKRENVDIKFVFKNAYGSGFLKNNGIPNDLDYSLGIYLGKYKYDGTNSSDIALDLIYKIDMFQTEFYNSLEQNNKNLFYSDMSVLDYMLYFSSQKKKILSNVTSSINQVVKDNDYIFYSEKKYSNDVNIVFPFVLKSNEILIEDFPPITLFSNNLSYNDINERFLREITIVPDYSFDLEKDGKVKHIEIVAEAFTGQRMQLSRRFFVPIVFFGENSVSYLKSLSYLKDDEEYIYYRLFNYGRHLQEIKNLRLSNDRPVKMLKRIQQCLDLIYPVLDEQVQNDIAETVARNLNDNKNLALLNTYTTTIDNLLKILSFPHVFKLAMNNHEIIQLLSVSDDSIKQLYARKILSYDDYEKLHLINKRLVVLIFNAKSKQDLQNIYDYLSGEMNKNIIPIEKKIFKKVFNDNDKISMYVDIFSDVYKKAGFHKIDLYWIKKDTLGIIKDDFTSLIPEKDLHSFIEENGLTDNVNYILIDKKDINILSVRYSVWVRYKASEQENIYYNKLREALLKDKKNFNIKRKFVF